MTDKVKIVVLEQGDPPAGETVRFLRDMGYEAASVRGSVAELIGGLVGAEPDIVILDLGDGCCADDACILESIKQVTVAPLIVALEEQIIERFLDGVTCSYSGYVMKPLSRLAVKVAVRATVQVAALKEERVRAEEIHRHMFMNSQVGLFRTGLGDGRVIECNDQLARFFGYDDREQMIGSDFSTIDYYADPEARARVLESLHQEGEISAFVTPFRRRDGSVWWARFSGSINRDKSWFDGVVEDYTETKTSQDELRASQQRLRSFLDSAVDAFTVWDSDLRLIDFNSSALAMAPMGSVTSELLGRHIAELLPELRDPQRLAKFKAVLQTGVPHEVDSHFVDYRDRPGGRIDGHNLAFLNVKAFKVDDGLGIVMTDVTERKLAEEKVLQLRRYLSNIIDSMPSVLIGVDQDGRVTQWNNATERATGIAADEAVGKALADIHPMLAAEFPRIVESIRTRRVIQERKVRASEEGGTTHEDVTIFPLVTNGVQGAVIRVDEVTDKVRMEEMLIQSEKMLSVGGLAAGMAHEINNPLAGIIGAASVMRDRLAKTDMPANARVAKELGVDMAVIAEFMERRGIPKMMSTIVDSGRRVSEIVANMLSFARKSERQRFPHDLSDLVDRTVELAAADYSLKKQYDFKLIQIVREYDNVPKVSCVSTEVQQVILNLLSNAAHAMRESETKEPTIVVRLRAVDDGHRVRLEIEDNGPGMDEAMRKRIFEPFFTTKPVGVGTGLGLSVSYFIITDNNDGDITVESEPGKGTNFIVTLPAAVPRDV